MGLIGTIIVFTVLASLNVWCSKLLIDVKHYCDTHVLFGHSIYL